MRYRGPRNRIARRVATDLGFKTIGTKAHASLLKKLNVPPGQHGARSRRKISDYGKQIQEKQKIKYTFGVTERQMKNYLRKALKKTGNTSLYLSQFLEQRLDNIIYKLGFVPTRMAARQLITHGHIKVGDRIVDVPSYQVKIGNIISFTKEKTTTIPYIENTLSKKDTIIPDWLERKGVVGKMISLPSGEEIGKQINLRAVIGFYSR